MLGVGAGVPAPPLVRSPPVVVAPRVPPFFSLPLPRRRRTAAAAKQNQGRRRWWSDSDQEEYEEEEEEYDDYFPNGSFGGELFEEPWFSKVFKTYGYLLPVMLASMLVATGPRAFLMAMAIPLGQSAISFLLEAIWGRNGRRRQPPPFEEEEEEEDFPKYSSDFASASGRDSSSSNSYYGRQRQSYQSWVSDDFVAGSDDYSSNDRGGGQKTSGFGGWDELVVDKDEDDAAQARNKASSRPLRSTSGDAARGMGAPLSRKRARMSASSKYKQAPMLMRLLVAVFPFLGSWFRLL